MSQPTPKADWLRQMRERKKIPPRGPMSEKTKALIAYSAVTAVVVDVREARERLALIDPNNAPKSRKKKKKRKHK